MIKKTIKHYKHLSKDEFHDVIALRLAVFVVEQNCPYQDLDGLDKDAYHLICRTEDKIIGTLRILNAGVCYNEVAIGRVVSHEKYRTLKLGHQMMNSAISFIEKSLNEQKIRLSAQTHLINFYGQHGFRSTGKEYLEDGIPHTEMLRTS